MAFNEQRNKNKAKVWTVIVHLLLMLWFAFYGLTYQDPPPEEGIAINFGYEETGAGENTQAAPTIPPPTPSAPVETPPVQEEVVTQDVEDAPVIESTDDPTPTKPKEEVVDTRVQRAAERMPNCHSNDPRCGFRISDQSVLFRQAS